VGVLLDRCERRKGGREEGLSEELKDFRGNNGGCQSGF